MARLSVRFFTNRAVTPTGAATSAAATSPARAQDFPISVPVASHVPHAAGVALAMKLRHEARAVLCIVGDGATSKGDFYEALNVAGVWRLPLVVLISQQPMGDLGAAPGAERGRDAGAEGDRRRHSGRAGRRQRRDRRARRRGARARAGPRGRRAGLIEALTYRLGDHTTADDARRYRDDAEVSAHWHGEPVARLRQLPGLARRLEPRRRRSRRWRGAAAEIDQAAEAYLATPPQPVSAMFDHLFAELPAALAAQRAQADGRTSGGDA